MEGGFPNRELPGAEAGLQSTGWKQEAAAAECPGEAESSRRQPAAQYC
jgi:hypothetical protein